MRSCCAHLAIAAQFFPTFTDGAERQSISAPVAWRGL
jgi:hypothetical protein